MRGAPSLALAVVAAVLGPQALMAQAGSVPPRDTSDAASVSFETASGGDGGSGDDREVFVYPGGDRRDPFQRFLPGDSAGPRFEELRLIGVVLSPDPGESVALIEVDDARAPVPAGTWERTFRLRQDAVLGEVRVVRIQREYLIVEINRFGLAERLELRLDRPPGRDGR